MNFTNFNDSLSKTYVLPVLVPRQMIDDDKATAEYCKSNRTCKEKLIVINMTKYKK